MQIVKRSIAAAIAVVLCLCVPVFADNHPWEKGAEEYILQAQGFRDQASESWDWNLLVAATHYVSEKTQVGGVLSVLRMGSEGGIGIGPFYEYTIGCNDDDICWVIGGDAQKLEAGADDLAAWRAATRSGIKWQVGNIGIRFMFEYTQALDSETETTMLEVPAGVSLNGGGHTIQT